ncbi:MAG TPA: hypothetical protein VK582_04890 [Pyrinomonadaceae bacterium]|nr:hypothetical protein [Pyrinomonadaceae bacterium]
MTLSLRSLLPPDISSLRGLASITKVSDVSFRRQAGRILIVRHHERLGGLKGRIGFSMGDLQPAGVGGDGFSKPYSGGKIELLDFQTGPQGLEEFRAEVKFVGYRVADTNDASADEPYFLIGVTGANAETNVSMRTNVVEGQEIKADNNVVLHQMITTEAKPPFVLSVTGMDHDSGSPDEAAAKVTKSLNDFSAKLTLALPLLGVDPTIGAYVQSFLNLFGGTAGDIISGLLGMGDDRVGDNSLQFFDYDAAQKEWRTPKALIHADFDQPHNVELSLNNGEGGGYIAFFDVRLFKVSKVLVPGP